LKPNPFLSEREKMERQAEKDMIFRPGERQEPPEMSEMENSAKSQKEQEEQSAPNILGPELYELVFGRLDFKIVIENVKIYYEYNHFSHQGVKDLSLQKSFSVLFQLSDFTFTSVKGFFDYC
jgi:hypothetical protein